MRIARYELEGAVSTGVVEGEGNETQVRPFTDGAQAVALLEETPEERLAHPLGEAKSLADVKLMIPLQPPSVRDFVSFEQHVEGMVMGEGLPFPEAWYGAPAFYFSNPKGHPLARRCEHCMVC